MASSSFQLILLSFVMFLGSYFSGSAPLLVSLSEEKLQMVSVLGAGLLVGTALAVIIPEGVQTLMHAYATKEGGGHGEEDEKSHHHSGGIVGEMEGLDRAIGVSLVLGFVFMLLVDQLASARSKSSSSSLSVIEDSESSSTSSSVSSVTWTTTLGLVVHAAADGIALGAAATTDQSDVEFIVFLAIMLHKAPASFGLTTFLLHEGMDRQRVRKHLLIFALSAPLTALLTYALLHPGGMHLDTMNATGIAMLFSAGTFLYVSTVHVLPEVVGKGSSGSSSSGRGGGGGGHSHNHKSGFSKCDLFMLVLGALLPLLLTLGHHH